MYHKAEIDRRSAMNIKEFSDAVMAETEKIIVGKSDRIRLIIMSVLSDGHVLLDDMPGVGKTTLVKTISKALGCESTRIQFVPDLMPSDILGMKIFNQRISDFELKRGPIHTNILLADEINRAIPRTQSALLEAMEERQVTIDGDVDKLPDPFIVLATQNPVEAESTFKLPVAQMDRFLIKLSIGYPKADEERHMLEILGNRIPFESVKAVSGPEAIAALRKEAEAVFVSDKVADYIVAIANKTRTDSRLKLGISPRGTRAMYRAVKVWAAMDGRDHATPDDVKDLLHPVFEHRIVCDRSFGSAGDTAAILDEIAEEVQAAPELEDIVE